MKVLKIGFTVIIGLLLLGFVFNQSLANQFLTKVNYIVPKENAPIVVSIGADAQFEPMQSHKLSMNEDVLIESVYVRVGEKVDSDTPLFKVVKLNGTNRVNPRETSLSEEIRALNKQLEVLKAQEALTFTDEKILKKRIEVATKEVEEVGLESSRNTLALLELDLEKIQSRKSVSVIERKYLETSLTQKKSELEDLKQSQLVLMSQYITVNEEGVYNYPDKGVVLELPRVGDVVSAGVSIARISDYDDIDFVLNVAVEASDFLSEGEQYTFMSERIKGIEAFKDGIHFKVDKKNLIAENGMVQIIDQGGRSPLIIPPLYQKWQGIIEKTIKAEGVTVPKHVILTGNGRYSSGQEGQVFVINTRKGALGDEDVIETVDVRILLTGDYECVISGLEKDATDHWPRIVMNIGHEIKSGMRVFVVER